MRLVCSLESLLVRYLLLHGNRQSIDTKEVANSINDKVCPSEICHHGKNEITLQVVKLDVRCDLGEPKHGQVA